jgi:hypothetical protein
VFLLKDTSKSPDFGVVVGVIGELNTPYSPVNKGRKGIG